MHTAVRRWTTASLAVEQNPDRLSVTGCALQTVGARLRVDAARFQLVEGADQTARTDSELLGQAAVAARRRRADDVFALRTPEVRPKQFRLQRGTLIDAKAAAVASSVGGDDE